MTHEKITTVIDGAEITVDAHSAVIALLSRLTRSQEPRYVERFMKTEARSTFVPAVRSYWNGEGGINAGLYTPRDGSRPYYLIPALVPAPLIKDRAWGKVDSVDDALSVIDGELNTAAILRADPGNVIASAFHSIEIDGHRDFYWPARYEAAHLYTTCGDLINEFVDSSAVWTSTQPADDRGCAYVQSFVAGSQLWSHKSNEFAAVAVRRKFID